MDKNKDSIQRMSEMPEGAIITVLRVGGDKALRQRLMEMGFVKGVKVKVVKNAPLLDPVEYDILGTHVSLRRNEAAFVEVLEGEVDVDNDLEYNGTLENEAAKKSSDADNAIVVALIGNPNCGKTSLFNFATGQKEKTGNYGGVTVDSKIGEFYAGDVKIRMVDLPGTYSLTEFSPEEMYVRTYLSNNRPDVILNIVDSCSLERNMYLTTQIMDMNIPIVMALNMYDEFEKRGDKIDKSALGRLLDIDIVPIVAREGRGIDELLRAIIATHSRKMSLVKSVNYGEKIEQAILELRSLAGENSVSRYDTLKLLEADKHAISKVSGNQNYTKIEQASKKWRQVIEREYNDDIVTIISDKKYGFIKGALAETYTRNSDNKNRLGYALDVFFTDKWLGLPLLFLMMWVMFQSTFTLGAYPQGWIESLVDYTGELVSNLMPEGTLRDLLVDGIISGVGGVLVFLPNILILFVFISLLEDSGYMARAAFIVDRLMHRIGLHGKSFIPYLIGFGCGVPAIMATRTLENRRDRIITIVTIPFMSCSARLPVYLLFVAAFFAKNQGVMLMLVYMIGVLVASLTAIVLSKTILRHETSQWVMELPPYRVPTVRNTIQHMWSKASQYLHKMGTVILCASIIIWALGYFPHNPEADSATQIENSYIGKMGKAIEPVVKPLGFDWKMGISVLSGVAAKEVIVSSMGILYGADDEEVEIEDTSRLQAKITAVMDTNKAFSFMLFVLLYFPCIAALAAIRREIGTKWALFSMVYSCFVAWVVSCVFYQISLLL